MLDKDIQARIDKLYRDMEPLFKYYGIKPRTIEERYEDYLRKEAIKEQMTAMPKPRFKLPKL